MINRYSWRLKHVDNNHSMALVLACQRSITAKKKQLKDYIKTIVGPTKLSNTSGTIFDTILWV